MCLSLLVHSMSCDTDANVCVECLSNEQCFAPEASSCDFASSTAEQAVLQTPRARTRLIHLIARRASAKPAVLTVSEEDCGAFSCDPATFTCTDTERDSLIGCEECSCGQRVQW